MNTLSVSVRYRPIRIGWCVRAGDFAALREAMKLTFTMWGGRYNPVIPIDDFATANTLIRLFRVDVLWPVTDGGELKEFIKQFPHLPNPFFQDELFVPHGNGGRSPQLLDIYHPVRRLHEEQFKNNPSPTATVTIFEWQPDDPLADVLLASLGAVPPVAITGTDYLALLKQHLSANTVTLAPLDPFPQFTGIDWTVSTFCCAFLQQHYSVKNSQGHPGIYIGNSSDFNDLINFWNLRATNTSLLFYDPNQAARLGPALTNWLQALRTRPKGRFESDNSIAIWFKDGMPEPDISMFGQGLRLCIVRNGTWTGLNVKAPCMYFSEGSALAAIGESAAGLPMISFQLPPKPFDGGSRLYDQHFVVSIDPGIGLSGTERATLHTPYVPELNQYYGRQLYFEWDKARVEPDCVGIISNASRSDLSLTALDVVELVQQIFSAVGIAAHPSKPGLIANQLIHQMGGLQKCRVFKIAGVRDLIEKYSPDQSFTRSGATQIIRGTVDEITRVAAFDAYKDLHIEARPRGTDLSPGSVLAHLLKKGVFRAGLKSDCPRCRLQFWTSLDDVRAEASCEYCGHKFNITPYLKDRDWAFRRSGLFGKNDHQEGAIPVMLTLQQLHTVCHSQEMLFTTAISLKRTSAAIQNCETDFVVVIQNPRDGKIDIAIGECKTKDLISDDDVNNLKAVADSFPSKQYNAYIIFSKLDSFSPEELTRVRQLNNEHRRRVILFTARELEPNRLYEQTAKEFTITPYAVSLEDMAKITEQVFLVKRQQLNS